jgi:YggT family protein
MTASDPLTTALVFLIGAIFGFYILLLMLRLILQWAGVGFRSEPILQFLYAVTQPSVAFLHGMAPRYRGKSMLLWQQQQIDMAVILLLMMSEMLVLLLTTLLFGQHLSWLKLILLSIANLISLLLNIFFWSILLEVVLSWVNSYDNYNPITNILYNLNRPLLRPVRRALPAISGLDLSPLVVLLLLQVTDILVVGYLQKFAGYFG